MLAPSPCVADLAAELAALHAERDPLVEVKARAELLRDQAATMLDAARATYDTAVARAKAAADVAAAQRALARHDAAIRECAADLAAARSHHKGVS
jgi:N-acetylmuramic acid 6-phosphate (MurNAc-6-P) etherase